MRSVFGLTLFTLVQLCLAAVCKATSLRGTTRTINGVQFYVSSPLPVILPNQRVLLFLTDVLGVSTNNKLAADKFAAEGGFVVVMPDLFNGDPITPPVDPAIFPVWSVNHGPETVEPILTTALNYINTLSPRSVGVTGYCFGGKYAFRLLARTNAIVAGVSTHPSLTTMEEIGAVIKPVQVVGAELDDLFPAEQRHAAENLLVAASKPNQFIAFSGVEHGFAVSTVSSSSTVEEKYARQKSTSDAIDWLKAWMA